MHADSGTIQNNLIGFAGRFGVFLSGGANSWTVQGNEIRGNAINNASQDGMDIGNSSMGATVSGNLFVENQGGGLDSWNGLGGNLVENNTFLNNGLAGLEPAAYRVFGTGNTIRLNDFQDNVGAGVMVIGDNAFATTGDPSTQNRISQNRFSNNGTNGLSNAIDLLTPGADGSLGDGITLNDLGTDLLAGNIGLDYPVIASADKSGATTTIIGTTGVNFEVEIYLAVATGAGDTSGGNDYGEGVQYLGTVFANGAGDFTFNTTALNVGDDVSAIAIDTSNNTSEFGQNFTVVSANTPPVATDDAYTVAEDGTLTLNWWDLDWTQRQQDFLGEHLRRRGESLGLPGAAETQQR
jgi:hypothetical protein